MEEGGGEVVQKPKSKVGECGILIGGGPGAKSDGVHCGYVLTQHPSG